MGNSSTKEKHETDAVDSAPPPTVANGAAAAGAGAGAGRKASVAATVPQRHAAETRITPHPQQRDVHVRTLLFSSAYGCVDTRDGAPLPLVPDTMTVAERKAWRADAANPQIGLPWGVVIDATYGDVYFTDSHADNAAVRHISSTGVLRTFMSAHPDKCTPNNYESKAAARTKPAAETGVVVYGAAAAAAEDAAAPLPRALGEKPNTRPRHANFALPRGLAIDSQRDGHCCLYVSDSTKRGIWKVTQQVSRQSLVRRLDAVLPFVPKPVLSIAAEYVFDFTDVRVEAWAGGGPSSSWITPREPPLPRAYVKHSPHYDARANKARHDGGWFESGALHDHDAYYAAFQSPAGLCVDSQHCLIVCDTFSNALRRVVPIPDDPKHSKHASAPVVPLSPLTDALDPATRAVADYVRAMRVDYPGQPAKPEPWRSTIDFADENELAHRYRTGTAPLAGRVVTTYAGTGARGHDDGDRRAAATFGWPEDCCIDARDNVFVADTGNNLIRRIDGVTGRVTTLAGSGLAGHVDAPNGRDAAFSKPKGICVHPTTGVCYVADSGNGAIRAVEPNGAVTTLVGAGVGSSRDGPGPQARFADPACVAVSGDGLYLLVTETVENRIRKITLPPPSSAPTATAAAARAAPSS